MNTKTMRLPPRRVLTPSGTTNKRKERDDPFERPKPITATPTKLLKPDKPVPRPGSDPIISATPTSSSSGSGSGSGGGGKGLEPKTSNHLLAGYLAHEYLTKGTLLGHPWAPSRAEGPPTGEKRKGMEDDSDGGSEEGEAAEAAAAPCWRAEEEEKKRYADVAGLFKGGGTHLPGVVNPTQLARFLHL